MYSPEGQNLSQFIPVLQVGYTVTSFVTVTVITTSESATPLPDERFPSEAAQDSHKSSCHVRSSFELENACVLPC